MCRVTRYSIQYRDLGIEYRDCGPWRSYDLCASGNSMNELVRDAIISEIDQDGGTLASYGLEDASNEVRDAVLTELKGITQK